MKRRKVTIDRGTWVNGRHGSVSQLLNSAGERCCLGFAIHQITKCSIGKLEGLGCPENLFKGKSFLTITNSNGYVFDNRFAERAIEINDDHEISDASREKQLKKLFAKNNITLTFKGEYV